MSPVARVIALGQTSAGDDGVGVAVLEELRRRRHCADVELRQVSDATSLIPLLDTRGPVLLVDAVLGVGAGEVIELDVDQLSQRGVNTVSSHGVGVAEALRLAHVLAPESLSPSIRIIGVGIERATRFRSGLSPAVAAAVGPAADAVLAYLQDSSAAAADQRT